MVKTVRLTSGRKIPVLGQGTWRMGEDPRRRKDEIESLRLGVSLGMTLIDTAEMYGDGGAEEVVAEAVGDQRDQIYLVSKVLPSNASLDGTIAACERSLRRLGTDHLDLYLLHWRGDIPLDQTLEAFRLLQKSGKILDYGVSNFDVADMEEAMELPGGAGIVTNQVLYNLSARGIEWDLVPWSLKHHIPIMGYTPLGRDGAILDHPAVKAIALRHSVAPVQVALAWVLRDDNMIAIPKASTVEHVRQNFASLSLRLTAEDLNELDEAFPPPAEKVPLELL